MICATHDSMIHNANNAAYTDVKRKKTRQKTDIQPALPGGRINTFLFCLY